MKSPGFFLGERQFFGQTCNRGFRTAVCTFEQTRRQKSGSMKEHKIRLRDVFCLQRPGGCRREDLNKGRIYPVTANHVCETDNRCLATRRPCVVIDEWPLGHSSLFLGSPLKPLGILGDNVDRNPTCYTRTAAMMSPRRYGRSSRRVFGERVTKRVGSGKRQMRGEETVSDDRNSTRRPLRRPRSSGPGSQRNRMVFRRRGSVTGNRWAGTPGWRGC